MYSLQPVTAVTHPHSLISEMNRLIYMDTLVLGIGKSAPDLIQEEACCRSETPSEKDCHNILNAKFLD